MSPTFGPPAPEDFPRVLAALATEQPQFYGFRDVQAWRAMARMVCPGDPDLIALVARDGDRIAAFGLALLRPASFWPRFCARVGVGHILRHALAGQLARFRKRPPAAAPDRPGAPDPEGLGYARSWHQDTPGVAKAVYVYVAPEHRNRSLGRALLADLAARAQAEGFTRMDAQVRFDNPASVRMLESLGYEVRHAGTCFHAVKPL